MVSNKATKEHNTATCYWHYEKLLQAKCEFQNVSGKM